VQLEHASGTLIGGDFRLEALIARGGMGSIYRAVQLSTDRPRAIKLLHPMLVEDELARERFFREARVGAHIPSDHVVEVISSGVDGGTPWLAMELLEGEDLAARLRRGPLAAGEAHRVFAQLGDALGAAHSVGVVHRDLKPENVFLARVRRSDEPVVKVLDFGIARLLAESPTATAPCGTPLFMAPEQATGGPVGPTADVWALGLLAFFALTGRYYWRSAGAPQLTPMMVLREATDGELVPASRRALELGAADRLSPGFADWFGRCVVRDPAARFPDATSATAALLRLLGGALASGAGVTERMELVLPRSSEPGGELSLSATLVRSHPARWVARRWRPLAAAALALGLAAVVGRTAWLRRAGAGSPAPALEAASAGGAAHLPTPAAAAPIERWLVPIGNSPSRGPAEAPVTIVEFADFQCPYSKVATTMLKRLFDRFPQKLRLVWKDYPSSLHRYSDGAAQVAREVTVKRGPAAFWRAHDLLFAAGPQLQPPRLIKQARALGLGPEAVQAALDGAPHRAAIDADVDLGARVGVGISGIPTFFVNGRKAGEDDLEQVVAEELAEARRRLDSGVPAARLYEDFERGAREHGDDWRRVALPDPGSRPSRGGSPRTALPVHEFCALNNFFCALIEPVVHTMLDGYGDEVRLVWWDVSDPQQPEAARLALAADGVRARFWELHDLVLAKQVRDDFIRPPPESLSTAVLRRYAQQIGADLSLFDYVMATGRVDVEQLNQARALGLRPASLVIDGEVHSGTEPPHLLRLAIDRALARRSPPAR